MKTLKRLFLLGFFFALTGAACDSLEVETTKNVADDPIGDITLFNNQFHTTNVDTSGNAGPQIDLIRLADDGQRLSNTSLKMNGQGYMAITDDEEKFYLLSRRYGTLYTISADGQQVNGQWADLGEVWHPTALTYVDNEDRLLMLYRNIRDRNQYRARLVDKNNIGTHKRDLVFSFDFISTGTTGIYSLAYNFGRYFALGYNQQGNIILIEMNPDFEFIERTPLSSNQVAGLAFRGNDLYLSFFDGSLRQYNTN